MNTDVIAGLDPQSICFEERFLRRWMDARIIPDQVGDRRPGMTSVCLRVRQPQFQTTTFPAIPAATASRSRRVFRASFAINVPPSSIEGAGNAGRPMRPIAACATVVVAGTRVVRSHRHHPAFPTQWFTAYGVISPAIGFLATVAPKKPASQELDASVEASGPHVFAVRIGAVRQERQRGHRILSRVRDDIEPPLCGPGRGGL